MTLHRHALSALLLFVCAPFAGALVQAGTAEAGVMLTKSKENSSFKTFRYGRSALGGQGPIGSVDVTITSDAGREELPLVESDAWLHGSTTLAALPEADAELTLTLYDNGSAALISFSGTLAADGSVSLAADDTAVTDSGACTSRVGCEESPRAEAPDIEVLAAEVFAVARGYDLGLDLAGADTYAIAYARVTVTETTHGAGGSTGCATRTGCDGTGEDPVTTVTTAEVDWDDIGSIWEVVATLEHEGPIDVTVKARDAAGETIDTAKATLAAPWLDDGEGVSALATDGDPLTSVALHALGRHFGALQHWHALTVVSEGWAAGEPLPTHAEVRLTGGDTLTIPVNSYQRIRQRPETLSQEWDALIQARRRGGYQTYLSLARNGSPEPLTQPGPPLCSEGFCVVVIESAEGGYELAVTAYGGDASALPDEADLEIGLVDERGAELASQTLHIAFDDAITAVFGNEISLLEDSIGLCLSGRVKLLGDADRHGQQRTLATGMFHGTFSRDGDGDLALAGAHADDGPGHGEVILAGDAVLLTDREGLPAAPPAIQYANGSGTKNASSQTSTRPQLL